MTHLWMLNLGFPLMVLGVRFMMIRSSLVRARRAGQASTPGLRIPWREVIILTGGSSTVLVVGLIYYLLLSHPEGWTIVNTGALLVTLGIGHWIQARAQRLPETERLKSESLIRIAGYIVTLSGFALITAYVIISRV